MVMVMVMMMMMMTSPDGKTSNLKAIAYSLFALDMVLHGMYISQGINQTP